MNNKPTKEELLGFLKHHSRKYIARKIIHKRDTALDLLLSEYGITKEPFYKRKIYPEITSMQKEFILGSLLGDASVVKKGPQHRLSLSHSHTQYEYIKHKQNIMGELSTNNIQNVTCAAHDITNITRGKPLITTIGEYHGHILHSKVHPYFTELRNILYPNNKKTICYWWLNQLTDRSLAYWFMDDGCADWISSYYIAISTYSCTYDEHVLLHKFIWDKFGVKMKIQSTPHRGCGYSTRMNKENSEKFKNLVEPYIINSMKYKIDKLEWIKKSKR